MFHATSFLSKSSVSILLITIPSNEKALELLGARSKLHGEREIIFSYSSLFRMNKHWRKTHTKPLLPIHKYDCDGTFSSDTAELNSHRLPYKQRKESVSHKLQMYVLILTFLPSHGFCGRLGSETTHCLHLVPTCLGISTSERTEQPKPSVRPAHIHVITTPCTQPLELFL